MVDTIAEGLSLYSGDPSSVVPAGVAVPVPKEGRGWVYVSVVTAAHASDTTTVAIHGKLNSGDTYKALTKSDQSTAASVAQSAGGLSNTLFAVQAMPYMKVVLSGTSTSGASTKVWVEAAGAATRTDS